MRQVLQSRQIYLYSLIYFVIAALGHWGLSPALGILVFSIGGIIGLHLLDATELALDIKPSPFRNILTQLILVILGFFVVTSSQTNLGNGVVLFLLLRLLLEQWIRFNKDRNLSSWLPQMPVEQHKTYLLFISFLFVITTLLFMFV